MPLSYYEAALEVLRDADHPLSSAEIAEEAVRRGLIQPSGRTPGNTMSATLYRYTLAGDKNLVRVAHPGHGRRHRYTLRQKMG